MIRVTLELVSAVDPSRDKILGVAYIANTQGTPERADYSVWLSKWAPKEKDAWKQGRAGMPMDQLEREHMDGTIRGFDRVHRGAWDLLYCCLRAVVGSRNPNTPPGMTGRTGG